MRLGRWNYARLRNAAFHRATIGLNQGLAEELARVGEPGDRAFPMVQTGDGRHPHARPGQGIGEPVLA